MVQDFTDSSHFISPLRCLYYPGVESFATSAIDINCFHAQDWSHSSPNIINVKLLWLWLHIVIEGRLFFFGQRSIEALVVEIARGPTIIICVVEGLTCYTSGLMQPVRLAYIDALPG